jgi:hypothetical protein
MPKPQKQKRFNNNAALRSDKTFWVKMAEMVNQNRLFKNANRPESNAEKYAHNISKSNNGARLQGILFLFPVWHE